MTVQVDVAIEQVRGDLVSLGVRRGGVLLVHSSLRSLGSVPEGASSIVQGLIDTLGAWQGTLFMPALSYMSVSADNPVFDIRTTPSCVGAIPEYFRNRPDVLRSSHPTHSVCGLGQQATAILDGHGLDDTPCGPSSPYRRLRQRGGAQLLFIGCGLKPNTSMHAVEELVVPPYLFRENRIALDVIDYDGAVSSKSYLRHAFDGVHQRYDRIEQLLSDTELRTGRVLEANCHLLEFDAMWDAALEAITQDNTYFVDQAY